MGESNYLAYQLIEQDSPELITELRVRTSELRVEVAGALGISVEVLGEGPSKGVRVHDTPSQITRSPDHLLVRLPSSAHMCGLNE